MLLQLKIYRKHQETNRKPIGNHVLPDLLWIGPFNERQRLVTSDSAVQPSSIRTMKATTTRAIRCSHSVQLDILRCPTGLASGSFRSEVVFPRSWTLPFMARLHKGSGVCFHVFPRPYNAATCMAQAFGSQLTTSLWMQKLVLLNSEF